MDIKFVEIRDVGTFIPAMAIQVSGKDGYLMRRAGFQNPMIYLVALATEKCGYDSYGWGNRTMAVAHQWLEKNWDDFVSNGVVDVEYILGETIKPKESEETADPL